MEEKISEDVYGLIGRVDELDTEEDLDQRLAKLQGDVQEMLESRFEVR